MAFTISDGDADGGDVGARGGGVDDACGDERQNCGDGAQASSIVSALGFPQWECAFRYRTQLGVCPGGVFRGDARWRRRRAPVQ